MGGNREQQSHHASLTAHPLDACPEDEINLLDLWRVLARQWKVIAVITFLSVLAAVAYVFLAKPVYEAQVIVREPESKYVEALNIGFISQASSADIFAKFTVNLKSSFLLQQFGAENQRFFSLRGKKPKVKEGTKSESGLVFLSLQGHDPKLVADWLNGFILLAEKKTLDDFLAGVETNIANRKKEIQDQLQIGRDFANQRRLDRIAVLEDQIAIARAAKIFDRQLSGYSLAEGQSVGAASDTLQGPLYMRGGKALTAEKEGLEKRKNDEPFIDGFRDKQERLAQLDAGLKQLQAARAVAHAVTVEQSAIQAKRPVKPRRIFVLVLGVVLGTMFGICAALALNFVEQQKAQAKE